MSGGEAQEDEGGERRKYTPDEWARSLSTPLVDAKIGKKSHCRLRQWRDVRADIVQPSLSDHYLALHLGGPKRVYRRGEGRSCVSEIGLGAVSIISSGAAYVWKTEGPVEYAHLYLPPSRIDSVAVAMFDRDPRGIRLYDKVGVEDGMLTGLLLEMLDVVEGAPEPTYLEALADAVIARLLRKHSSMPDRQLRVQYALPPAKLSRILEYMDANIDKPVSIESMATVAGLSVHHFSRAFTRTTGMPPHAFLIRKRMELAKYLLRFGGMGIEGVAMRCGYYNASHFSTSFRKEVGMSPRAYRNAK